ncbi:C3HC zinc finger-like-domain-containing protein [Peziza echinospora]|nr:C3HC zinc finger-like-domain-containing protein [Peziza echinospora]
MYATKRKLHNLLQAATGGNSNSSTSSPPSPKPEKHASKLSTVFRSKSVANLQKATADVSAVTGHGSSLAPPGQQQQELKRPTTAGAIAGGDSSITLIPSTESSSIIVSSTHSSAATSPANPDPKKRRTFNPDTFTNRWSIRSTNPISNSSSDLSTNTTTTTTTVSEKPTPAYAPWDRPQFLERLKTFRFVDKWTAKPADVNEVVWAKRGWICVDKNRVKCTVCSREVVVKIDIDEAQAEDGDTPMEDASEILDREERRKIQRELVDRYRGMVLTEHESYCLWRRKGCDDTIYHLPLANPSHSIPALRNRYTTLLTVKNDLPAVIDYPSKFIDLSLIRHALPHLLQEPHNTTLSRVSVVDGAFLLALFGWASEEPSIPTLLTCSACFRRLGLWLFNNSKKGVAGNGSDGDGDPPVSRLDVVGEHRDYCPWVCKDSQGKEPGWKTLWKIVGLQVGTMGSRPVDFGLPQSPRRGHESTLSHDSTHSIQQPPPTPPSEKDRDEQTHKLESRLKRLKTVYFGNKNKKEKDGRSRASSLVVGLGRIRSDSAATTESTLGDNHNDHQNEH